MVSALKIPARGLSVFGLVAAWEQGLGRTLAEQALMLLITAYPEVPPERFASLSIGQRDACLLALRDWTLGSRLLGLTTCPACAERLELGFEVADIRASPPAELEGSETFSVSVAGYDVTFRLPNSLDMKTAQADDVDATRQRLLRLCVLSASLGGVQRPVDNLPGEVVAAIVERMEQADPQANLRLALSCPACGHGWQAIFDIAPFFWSEIEAWAHRILREVHKLASAYGWHEADILAMSPGRRQVYLGMVGR